MRRIATEWPSREMRRNGKAKRRSAIAEQNEALNCGGTAFHCKARARQNNDRHRYGEDGQGTAKAHSKDIQREEEQRNCGAVKRNTSHIKNKKGGKKK